MREAAIPRRSCARYGCRADSERAWWTPWADEISLRILRGELRPGARLPSVRALAEAHRVNVSTIQRALARLEESGIVVAKPRSGVEVLDPARHGGAGLWPLVLRHSSLRRRRASAGQRRARAHGRQRRAPTGGPCGTSWLAADGDYVATIDTKMTKVDPACRDTWSQTCDRRVLWAQILVEQVRADVVVEIAHEDCDDAHQDVCRRSFHGLPLDGEQVVLVGTVLRGVTR